MKNVLKVLLVCLSTYSASALAIPVAPINGVLNLGGAYNATGGPDLNDVTAITLDTIFPSYVEGDFQLDITIFSSGVGGVPASLTAFAPVTDFFTMNGWKFDLSTLTIDQQDSAVLDLSGTGIVHKDGFDDTGATWSFSAQSATSYSMQIATVPVPAAVWLFGSGLIGLVGLARRKA